MSDSVSFRNLMQEAIAGDEAAANKIVEEHTDALVRVARQRIGNKLGQRIDAEDVLQSVYRSFFGRLHEGQYEIQTGRDLWNLLVRMTLNKVCRKAKFHGAQKRNIGQERATAADSRALSLSELVETDEPDIDLTQIIDAVKSLADSIKQNEKNDYKIIIRSTIIPNTARNTILPILNDKLHELKFGLSVVPEFLREGNALDDFMNVDKIVIGSSDENSMIFVKKIFENFKGRCEFVETSLESAELIKYTNNAFFSMLISFSNEIANISEKIPGVDSHEILKALISDKRITSIVNNERIVPGLESYLIPGCGFGGSCFPKDIQAILDYAKKNKIKTPLLNAILEINEERPNKMVTLSESILGTLKNKRVSILGLTFKPETDDLRSSPALDAIEILLEKGANISTFDPILKSKPDLVKLPKECKICFRIEDALRDSDVAMIFTKWSEFKSLDTKFLKQFMKNPIIIDGRGFLDKEKFDAGTYFKIGYSE